MKILNPEQAADILLNEGNMDSFQQYWDTFGERKMQRVEQNEIENFINKLHINNHEKLKKRMNLLKTANENQPRTSQQIEEMIENAAIHYGRFLESMGYDYKADPQTENTPHRVAKSWMKDLAIGSVSAAPELRIFPNEKQYKGLVIQTGIRVNSMCAHHNLPFYGWASVAYIPGEFVLGLSKLNRVVDWFARRPQMQESLTQQIHEFLTAEMKCDNVAVSIASKHMCCGSRGIKHPESVMTTNTFSGVFMEKDNLVREEFLHSISKNGQNF